MRGALRAAKVFNLGLKVAAQRKAHANRGGMPKTLGGLLRGASVKGMSAADIEAVKQAALAALAKQQKASAARRAVLPA